MRKIVAGCCLGWFCTLAVAEENRIEPAKLEKIQSVGQGLLAAKRSYQRPPEQQQLLDDVKRNREMINTLLKTQDLEISMTASVPQGPRVPGTNSLFSQNLPVSALLPNNHDEQWRKKHASNINALIATSNNLSQQMQSAQQLHQKNHAKQKSKPVSVDTHTDSLLSFYPAEANLKLADLHSNIRKAIALPKKEREKELQRLSDQLAHVHGSLNTETVIPSTPTLSTRTLHRSDVNAAQSNSSGVRP